MPDMHVRRSGDDYADAFAALLPTGPAWSRLPYSVLMRTISGLSQVWGTPVDSRAADLLERETDPRLSLEMFIDWERNWGLPDDCFFFDGGDLAGRRSTLMRKMTIEGGQSREFFVMVGTGLGFKIEIHEYSPFMVGLSEVGDVRGDDDRQRWHIGPPEQRFYWTVNVGDVSLSWFRAGESQAGIDPHLKIGYPTDLECLLNRWKPAHTYIVFDYSGIGVADFPAGLEIEEMLNLPESYHHAGGIVIPSTAVEGHGLSVAVSIDLHSVSIGLAMLNRAVPAAVPLTPYGVILTNPMINSQSVNAATSLTVATPSFGTPTATDI